MQNHAFKSSVEQHLSVIQQQEMIINAQDEERVKRKKEKERRSREFPVKEKSLNPLELVAGPSPVYVRHIHSVSLQCRSCSPQPHH
jgi:hypothetical protein